MRLAKGGHTEVGTERRHRFSKSVATFKLGSERHQGSSASTSMQCAWMMGLVIGCTVAKSLAFGPSPPGPPGAGKCCNQYGTFPSTSPPPFLPVVVELLLIHVGPLSLSGLDFGKNGCSGCKGGEGAWCDTSKDVSRIFFFFFLSFFLSLITQMEHTITADHQSKEKAVRS